jgi:hypothetical protein
MDQQFKSWWLSRGVMGPVVSVLALLIGVFGGVQVDAATQAIIVDQVVGLASAGVVLIGSIVGIWGRIRAKQPIK